MRRRIRKAKVVACLRYCLRACMGQPYRYATKLRYGDLRVENKSQDYQNTKTGVPRVRPRRSKGRIL
jgi:hypothetical protein